MKLDLLGSNERLNTVSVLAADDDLQTLSALSDLLNEYGYDSITVQSGYEAIRNLQSRRFDVVLCNATMPDSSGLVVLMKARELHEDTIVIMMSGYADISMARKMLDLGANDFLVKPLSMFSLIIAIERNLRYKEVEGRRIIEQRNKVLVESIKALSTAMDAKEHQTVAHSDRLACAAMHVADAMGLSSADKSTLELAAYMHDIGKIGVPEAILLKPDRLSEAEWAEIKMHPDIGSNILSNIEELSDLAEIIRHHHERFDGKGYPDGLAGEQIPLLSRILTVVDAFDAMTSDRPYRKLMSDSEAISRLLEGAGTQFDSNIVQQFIECWQSCEQRKAA